MMRREFVFGLGAAVAWPLAVHAEQSKRVPLIGVLWPNPRDQFELIRQPLVDLGYVEGKNIRFEFRWAEGALDKLPQLAMELVRIPVDRATQTIPIVFVAMGDPLSSGVVASLARPGANLTGTTRMISEMSAKHVQLLREIDPALSDLAVLWNPNNSSHPPALRAVESSARSLSLQIQPFEVGAATDLDNVFAAVAHSRANGLLFIADPIFFIHLKRVADFVASSRLPAVGNFLEFPKLGGLMGYAPSLPDEYRHAASHIDKILRGARPADLPVEQPTKFQLVINVNAAKMLDINVPATLVASADELIE
jgi:putative ABC transport system substrate-binding protein